MKKREAAALLTAISIHLIVIAMIFGGLHFFDAAPQEVSFSMTFLEQADSTARETSRQEEPAPNESKSAPEKTESINAAAEEELPSQSAKETNQITEKESRGDSAPQTIPFTEISAGIGLNPPRYPESALRFGVEADFTVRLTIRPDGTVKKMEILGEPPEQIFIGSVAEAVQSWRFPPAARGDRITRKRFIFKAGEER